MRRYISLFCALALLAGCAGAQRSCTSFNATSFGADWVIVQYATSGTAFNCWKERGISVTNEGNSDGIYWTDSRNGHLVHISGWYNRVQVIGGDYNEAARLLGVDINKCTSGAYK